MVNTAKVIFGKNQQNDILVNILKNTRLIINMVDDPCGSVGSGMTGNYVESNRCDNYGTNDSNERHKVSNMISMIKMAYMIAIVGIVIRKTTIRIAVPNKQ